MNYNYRLILEIEGDLNKGNINKISDELLFIDAYNVEIDLPLNIIKVDFGGQSNESDKYIQKLINMGYKTKKLAVYDLDEVHG